jgi:hypothetical protein
MRGRRCGAQRRSRGRSGGWPTAGSPRHATVRGSVDGPGLSGSGRQHSFEAHHLSQLQERTRARSGWLERYDTRRPPSRLGHKRQISPAYRLIGTNLLGPTTSRMSQTNGVSRNATSASTATRPPPRFCPLLPSPEPATTMIFFEAPYWPVTSLLFWLSVGLATTLAPDRLRARVEHVGATAMSAT